MTKAQTNPDKIQPVSTTSELVTKRELAKRLKICERMVELMVNDKTIPVVRLGTAVRYNWNAVLEALENQPTQ